jgi:hypothetical protein
MVVAIAVQCARDVGDASADGDNRAPDETATHVGAFGEDQRLYGAGGSPDTPTSNNRDAHEWVGRVTIGRADGHAELRP